MAENELNKVLFIDNDRATVLIMKRLLKKNYSFESAFSAEEGLEKIKSSKYEVILLDINLGSDISGIDIFDIIRQNEINKNSIVFALTTRTYGEEDSKILEHGFDGYFPKPFDSDSIIKSIEFLLDVKKGTINS